MVAVILVMMLISSPAAAQMVQGEISANVVEPASISQNDDGTITTTGEPPLYCTTDSTGTMCYY